MIASCLVDQIKRLLAEGHHSQRQIARLTGVSRGTVGAIASGKRRERPPRERPWDEQPEAPAGPPQRCPGCGGMVYLPCRLCRVRTAIAQKRIRRPPLRPEEPLRLELDAPHWRRYQEVRARRQRAGVVE